VAELKVKNKNWRKKVDAVQGGWGKNHKRKYERRETLITQGNQKGERM